ncbi:hypothetical protein STENM327S_08342 [Streptomyces tendae]
MVPPFWPLLKPAGAGEILAHRMVWSLAFVAVALLFVRRWAWAGELLRQPRRLALVTVAAAVITVNWGVYIWAVNSGHVVEASLGYFINPLVTIAMGVLLLKERLRPAQWAAVGTGFAAVLVLTIGYGQPPWISLCLAFSFATYGLVKKKVNLGGVESLAAETAIQFLPALGYLLWLGARGESTFTTEGPWHLAARRDRHRHRDPAGLLRRGGDPRAAVHAGAAAVPGAGLPVPARRPVLRRGHAARALGGLRAGLAGADAADLGRLAHGPPDGAGAAGGAGPGGRGRTAGQGGAATRSRRRPPGLRRRVPRTRRGSSTAPGREAVNRTS